MTVAAPERRSPGRIRRVAAAVGAGGAATLLVAVAARLFGTPLGVADNGDGYRIYCGAGLSPLTVDRFASWKGGVVTTFATAPPTCDDPVPSSALVILRAAGATASGTWSLVTLGWWYAALVGVVVALAVGAASAASWWRSAAVAIPVLPLAVPTFSRFVVSTYGEPAGLLGMVSVGCGVAALLVTRPEHRVSRAVALALTAAGGLVAAGAKVAYLPVLAAAVLACAVVTLGAGRATDAPRGARAVRRRLAGPAVALVTVLVAVPMVLAALERQNAEYQAVNTHNVVFTLVLRELGPAATGPLGLPPEAAAFTGNGYFDGPPRPEAAWWRETVVDRPTETRRRAYELLATHPTAIARALGIALQATTRADLPYLSSAPADPAVVSPPDGDPGWSGARQPDLQNVLDASRRPPWIPTALVLLAAVAVATVRWQRRASPAAARFSTAAGLAAATAVALVGVAVLGDGYAEVFKHAWPAAYLLVVTGTCLVGTVVATVAGLLPDDGGDKSP